MRRVFGLIVMLATTTVVTSFLLVTRIFGRHPRLGARMTRIWARPMLWGYGVRTVVHVPDSLGSGPYVIVANHSSMMDIGTVAATMPIDFHFVSRPFFFKVPVMGWGMLAAGHISIERDNARKAKGALATLSARFKDGLSVCLFPEGTRSPDGTVQRYKRGPFLTAVQDGVPIVPVALIGTSTILPKKRLSPRPGRIDVVIGDPVPTEGMTVRDTKKLARDIEAWTREQVGENRPRE
ncbi:MAG: lysophospholipid acyltransferase family protein [Planctomycetota bacterium]|jgi:1-acyl-sn-glycerol-3-phosphate acyltransferase